MAGCLCRSFATCFINLPPGPYKGVSASACLTRHPVSTPVAPGAVWPRSGLTPERFEPGAVCSQRAIAFTVHPIERVCEARLSHDSFGARKGAFAARTSRGIARAARRDFAGAMSTAHSGAGAPSLGCRSGLAALTARRSPHGGAAPVFDALNLTQAKTI